MGLASLIHLLSWVRVLSLPFFWPFAHGHTVAAIAPVITPSQDSIQERWMKKGGDFLLRHFPFRNETFSSSSARLPLTSQWADQGPVSTHSYEWLISDLSCKQ